MKKIFAYIALVSFLLQLNGVCSPPAESDPRGFDSAYAAKAAGAYLNRFSTYGEILADFSKWATAKDVASLKEIYDSNGISLSRSTPKYSVEGATVFFENVKITIESDRTLSFSGRNFSPKSGQLGSLFEALRGLPKQEKARAESASPCWLTSCAYASGGAVEILVGSILVVGVTAALAVTAVGGAVVYIGKEIYESLNDGNVTCSGKFFVFRAKRRNMVGMASSVEKIIDPLAAGNLLGQKIESCSSKSADSLQVVLRRLKNKPSSFAPVEALDSNSSSAN